MDYSKVKTEVAREVLRQGEVQLQALLALTIASNQRAVTLCGILTATMVATFGGATAAYSSGNLPIALGAALTAALLLIAAAFCIIAMWPTPYYLPGYGPRDWLNDDALFGSFSDSLLNIAGLYDERIRINRGINVRSARALKTGVAIGFAAPPMGAALWCLIYFFGVGG